MQVLPSEIEEGNIEYKRCFYNLSESKINHLAAQMNWRINEGNGICHYYLGICDDGKIFENFTNRNLPRVNNGFFKLQFTEINRTKKRRPLEVTKKEKLKSVKLFGMHHQLKA